MANKFIFEVDDMAEGVYMASGSDCWTAWLKQTQFPEEGRPYYRYEISGSHNAADHYNNEANGQIIILTFDQPVFVQEFQGDILSDRSTEIKLRTHFHVNETGSISGASISVGTITSGVMNLKEPKVVITDIGCRVTR